MPVLTKEDRILISELNTLKGFGAKKLINEFLSKGWKVSTVSNFLDKLKKTGTIERRPGSGRPRTVRTESNVNAVDELVLSQEDAPQTHHTSHQISRATGISQTSVMRIIHSDLQLKCLKNRRAQQLTAANRLARLT